VHYTHKQFERQRIAKDVVFQKMCGPTSGVCVAKNGKAGSASASDTCAKYAKHHASRYTRAH